MDNYSDSPLHQQIYQNMKSKSTDELRAIWEKNDRTVWSDETFDVVYNLLVERLGTVPAQQKPITTEVSGNETDEDDEADTYHRPSSLFRISDWARNLSWVAITVTIVATLIIVNHRLPVWLSQGFVSNGPYGSPLVMEGAFVAISLTAGLVFFVVLQAVAEFAYVLIDIEENTRGTAKLNE